MPLKYTYNPFTGNLDATSSSSGGSGIAANNQRIGTLVSDTFPSSASSSNYTQSFASGNATFNNGNVQLTGGNGSYVANGMYYNYNGQGSMLENATISASFTSAVAGSGCGISFNTQGGNASISIFIDLSGGANRGQITIVQPFGNAVYATSATKLTFTDVTDTIKIDIRVIDKWTVVATATNITTPSNPQVSVNYTQAPSGLDLFRMYQPAIYTLGGTQKFTSLSLYSDMQQNPYLIIGGDSRVSGSIASKSSFTWPHIVISAMKDRGMVWAAGGNYIADLNAQFPELIKIVNGQKFYFVLAIAINNIKTVQTIASIQSDYLALIATIVAAGGEPITVQVEHLSGAFASFNTKVDTFNAWVATLGYKNVDLSTASGNPLNNSSDGVHLNEIGHGIVADAFISQSSDFIKYTGWGNGFDAINHYNWNQSNFSGYATYYIQNSYIGANAGAAIYLSSATNNAVFQSNNASAGGGFSNLTEISSSGTGGILLYDIGNGGFNYKQSGGLTLFHVGSASSFFTNKITGAGSNFIVSVGAQDCSGNGLTLQSFGATYDAGGSTRYANKELLFADGAGLVVGFKGGIQFQSQIYNTGIAFTPIATMNTTGQMAFAGSAVPTYTVDAQTGDIGIKAVGGAYRLHIGSSGDMAGQTTLVAGTKAITITGLTSSDLPYVTISSALGALTSVKMVAICTSNTLTITSESISNAIDTNDVSIVNYFILRPY